MFQDIVRAVRRRTAPRLLVAFAAALAWGAAARAADPSPFEAALRIEARGLALLLDHYRAEQAMLAPDPDRLAVFLSLPPGAPVALDEAVLYVDGQVVVRHRYGTGELARLAEGAVQPLYLGRLAAGEHDVRLDLRTRQGKVQAAPAHRFVKDDRPRTVEFRILGDTPRQLKVGSW